MRHTCIKVVFALCIAVICCACSRGNKNTKEHGNIYKGLYSFGPEAKSFKECNADHEYWVEDKSNQLELAYSGLSFEKPYEPVYVEVEGSKIPSGEEGKGSEFDTTLVVRRLIKITREIPQDMCE